MARVQVQLLGPCSRWASGDERLAHGRGRAPDACVSWCSLALAGGVGREAACEALFPQLGALAAANALRRGSPWLAEP